METGMHERTEVIDVAERWIMDDFRVWGVAGFFVAVEIDMTAAKRLVHRMREDGFPGSYVHLFIRAAALAFERHPDLHFLLGKNRRHFPNSIDIAVTVGSEKFCPSAVILENAGKKSLRGLAEELDHRAEEARAAEPEVFSTLRKWGWIAPSWLRRCIMRTMWSKVDFRRRTVGTFQLYSMNQADLSVPMVFPPVSAALEICRVKDRVVAIEGKPEVRPMVTLVCAADHKAWNGLHAQRFLTEISKILRRGDLDAEWP